MTNSCDLERYGTDILIKACGAAFKGDSSVVLHIKDYNPVDGSRQIKEWIAEHPGFPRVVWHSRFVPKQELLKLYAEMDALIAPFRGEGFGMKLVDAMAMGLPVVAPDFGGPRDYINAHTAEVLAWREAPVGPNALDAKSSYLGDVQWCEVELESFVQTLRGLSARKEEIWHRASMAVDGIRQRFSWDAAADHLLEALGLWNSRRLVEIAPQLGPSTKALSVIIPTKDRSDALGKTLQGYSQQGWGEKNYEIILVNDHGNQDELAGVVGSFSDVLPISVIENDGQAGPASARNYGIERASGDIVLITGDDIIPQPGFLGQHMTTHARHANMADAALGQTKLPPWFSADPFMQYLNGS
jgi:hypothetical protein